MSVPRQRGRATPFSARQGLSSAAVMDAWGRQRGLCLVCRRPLGDDYRADHDHRLAATHGHDPRRGCPRCFRGLLCNGCNSMLGFAADSPLILEAGARYLRAASPD